MIYLEERHLKIVRAILAKFPHTFYAFGSRVTGTHKSFSDLDLCVMQDLSDQSKAALSEEFEESSLPFKVDIVEWNKISQDFRDLIKEHLVLIQR